MTKVVVNRCFGGFGLSEEAYNELGLKWDGYGYDYNDKRTDPDLIRVVETLGNKANGQFADLEVVEVPDYVDWEIENYDGKEWVAERHSTW